MRKIKYKKGRKVQPSILEYTGVHKNLETQMQLFVYSDEDLTEYPDFNIDKFPETLDLTKINWLNIHGLNNIELIKSIGSYLDVDNFILGDINDEVLIQNILNNEKIDTIYHCAAYKHVPILEENVFACLKNNILGTYNLLKLSLAFIAVFQLS